MSDLYPYARSDEQGRLPLRTPLESVGWLGGANDRLVINEAARAVARAATHNEYGGEDSSIPRVQVRRSRMRAISHSLFRDHPISTKCAGCLEHLGFGTVEGYRGDQDYPICGDGMEKVLRRERERVTVAQAHNMTFSRFLHRLSTPHGGEEGRCLAEECRGSNGAIDEPSGGAQADHDTMARLVARSDPGGTHNENGGEDDSLAPPPGSYGDGLHHTHRCTRCRTTFPCREEHRHGGAYLRVREVVALCPYADALTHAVGYEESAGG